MNIGRNHWCRRWRQATLWMLLALLLAGCSSSVLYSSLDERQANEVVASLIEHHIDASKQPVKGGDSWQVVLGHGQDMPRAMAVLRNAGLPHKSTDIGAFFEKKGFVSSPIEDKHRFIYAREQQLDHTLRQLDGVVDAYVYLSITDKDPISDKPATGSASVIIIATPNADISSQGIDIKKAVMDGTQGLTDPNRVSVTTFRRTPTPVTMPKAQAAAFGGVVGWILLIAVAALAVLLAALMLWRNRRTLVTTTRPVGGLHRRQAKERDRQ